MEEEEIIISTPEEMEPIYLAEYRKMYPVHVSDRQLYNRKFASGLKLKREEVNND
jgi:hypothetical protein